MYGLIVQNTIGTLVTFIAKIWQFIVFFIVYDSDIVFEKENYKNNVGCIIFMVLVYPEIVMESCLTYEKKVNDCRKFYELRIFYSFFFRVCYNAVRIIDRKCNCIYSGGN